MKRKELVGWAKGRNQWGLGGNGIPSAVVKNDEDIMNWTMVFVKRIL